MYSSDSDESDNDTKRINFNEFLDARHHKYEWKDLEFHSYINEQKIFNLWEHDFDINIFTTFITENAYHFF